MNDLLLKLDKEVFIFINNTLGNPVCDFLMPVLRNKFTWIPLYIFIIGFFIKQYKMRGFYLVLLVIACVSVSDYVSASIIKPFFHRLRPCNDPEIKALMQLRVNCGSGYSFVSSHAANHFCVSILLIRIFRKIWKPILFVSLFWAFIISIAQVYVGVHYPMDILFGAILGIFIGSIMSIPAGRIMMNDK